MSHVPEYQSAGTSPPKPTPIRYAFEKIPVYLRERAQWVCWRYALTPKGHWTKVPYQARALGTHAATTRPSEWSTFDEAVAAYQTPAAEYDGIGYCLADDENIIGIDIDHAVEMVDDKVVSVDEAAKDIVSTMQSYTELSVSGTGVHIFAFGTKPGAHSRRGQVEMYARSRFLTFTGRKFKHQPATIETCQEQIAAVYVKYIDRPAQQSALPGIETSPAMSDDNVLAHCRRASNAEKFAALYDRGERSGDESADDFALIGHLRFYTQDVQQIERLMRGSALVRPKWNHKRAGRSYLVYNIEKALQKGGETYEGPGPKPLLGGKIITGGSSYDDGDLIVLNLGTVAPRAVDWLWPSRVPIGMLTIIAGPPGLGKSFITLDMTARITTGATWSDIGKSAPLGPVVLFAAEDAVAETIVPRLIALGANRDKVALVQGVQILDGKGQRQFNLTDDIARLERTVKAHGAKLVVFDPANSYLGGKMTGWKDTEVRSLLDPLKEMAERLRIAVVLVMHFKKGQEDEVLYQIGGSVGWGAVARSVFFCVRDPETPGRVYFPHAKINVGPFMPTLAYRITSEGTVEWGRDPIRLSVHEIVAAARVKPGPKQSARQHVKEWLVEYLKDGPKPAAEGERLASEKGYSGSLRRAMKDLGIESTPTRKGDGVGMFTGHVWTLPPRPEGTESAPF